MNEDEGTAFNSSMMLGRRNPMVRVFGGILLGLIMGAVAAYFAMSNAKEEQAPAPEVKVVVTHSFTFNLIIIVPKDQTPRVTAQPRELAKEGPI